MLPVASADSSGRPASDPALLDAVDVARRLDVDSATGLSAATAALRLERDGPNESAFEAAGAAVAQDPRPVSGPLTYLLLVAVAISLAAWAAEAAAGWPIDAVVIAAVIVLNGVLGFIQENKAENAVAALQSMTAAASVVFRDGELKTVPSAELVRGDILVLGEGDAVGADARLLSASALRISEASLTGESEAVTKHPAPLPQRVPLGDRHNMVFKGTAVAQGVGRAVVTRTGMGTEMGSIAEMLDATQEDPSPLQKELTGVSKLLGAIVIIIAVAVMVITAIVNRISTVSELVTVLVLGVSLAVAAVPEGLPAILSVVLSIGVQQMARRNAVVKKLHSVETLDSTRGVGLRQLPPSKRSRARRTAPSAWPTAGSTTPPSWSGSTTRTSGTWSTWAWWGSSTLRAPRWPSPWTRRTEQGSGS